MKTIVDRIDDVLLPIKEKSADPNFTWLGRTIDKWVSLREGLRAYAPDWPDQFERLKPGFLRAEIGLGLLDELDLAQLPGYRPAFVLLYGADLAHLYDDVHDYMQVRSALRTVREARLASPLAPGVKKAESLLVSMEQTFDPCLRSDRVRLKELGEELSQVIVSDPNHLSLEVLRELVAELSFEAEFIARPGLLSWAYSKVIARSAISPPHLPRSLVRLLLKKTAFHFDDPQLAVGAITTFDAIRTAFLEKGFRKGPGGYYATCLALGNLPCAVRFEFTFEPRRLGPPLLTHLALGRTPQVGVELSVDQSFADFQQRLEARHGPSVEPPKDTSDPTCRWQLGNMSIHHGLFDRFGLEEHLFIQWRRIPFEFVNRPPEVE